MSAKIIDGKTIAARVHETNLLAVGELLAQGIRPGLAVVLVGDDPASRAYVGAKDRKCKELGLHSLKIELPATTSQQELIALVQKLNADPAIHGILVQSPPPSHINEAAVVDAIDPAKDVDGFHRDNVARLVMGDPSAFVPCTPLGCQRLLLESGLETEGAHVVVLGRSMIVGKPLALLLMQKGTGANATVTVAHSRSKDLEAITRSADILIAAIGQPEFVRGRHLRPGAVLIDVGINRVDDPSTQKGYRLVGDAHYGECAEVASWITPVPGGVGPMTIAMLMANTIKACQQAHGG